MLPTLLLPALAALLVLLAPTASRTLRPPAPAASRTPRPPAPTASSFRPQSLSLFVQPYNYLKFREHPPPKGRKLKMQPREYTKGDYPWREPQAYSHKLRMPGLRVNLGTRKYNQLLFDIEKFRSVRPKRGKFEEDAEGGKRGYELNRPGRKNRAD